MSLQPAFHESLPYIDAEPSAQELAAARALISAEEALSPPLNAPTPPPSKFSPAIQAELERIASGDAAPLQPSLDLSRYEAQEPAAAAASPDVLRDVLAKAYVSHAYLEARCQNLDLLDRWGKNAWLVGNYQFEADLRALEKELADVKKHIDVVNYDRKRRQDDVAAEVHLLEENWRKGIGRVLETELAVEDLKTQIREELRNRSAADANPPQ
ncbi:Pre-mRNA-splicing factor SPF27 [Stachybotrys elegans]|uniref:Pre-mRNA-splicing factor SPF27 n=1 Tax=Stachybotrys elegans TaxID=80388 RepID=A0A8K0WVK3_9HYPO|nr:Pre-mRNA-splicing factor SPF27 [Stachybotrys elegans]